MKAPDIIGALKGLLSLSDESEDTRKLSDEEYVRDHLGFEYPDEAQLATDLEDTEIGEAVMLAVAEEEEDEPVEEATPDALEDSEGEQDAGESEEEVEGREAALAEPVYRLPIELSKAEETDKGLFKKTLFHIGRKVKYGDRFLDLSLDAAKKMLANLKEKAYDQVPLLSHHPQDKAQEVFAYLGELKDAAIEGDKVVGFFDLTKRGKELVEENPNLGTSIGYHEDYHRKNDGRKFGPTLQHVATTFKPHINGLEPWELVQMSSEAEVVDLTGEEFTPQEPRKERDPVSEVVADQENREEVGMEEKNGNVVVLEEKIAELETKLEAERSGNLKNTQMLREQGVNGMLERMVADRKLHPANAKAMRVVLSAFDSTAKDIVELSSDGSASLKDDEFGKALFELAAPKSLPEEGERGTSEGPDTTDLEERMHARAEQVAKEEGISYREAVVRLSGEEG